MISKKARLIFRIIWIAGIALSLLAIPMLFVMLAKGNTVAAIAILIGLLLDVFEIIFDYKLFWKGERRSKKD